MPEKYKIVIVPLGCALTNAGPIFLLEQAMVNPALVAWMLCTDNTSHLSLCLSGAGSRKVVPIESIYELSETINIHGPKWAPK